MNIFLKKGALGVTVCSLVGIAAATALITSCSTKQKALASTSPKAEEPVGDHSATTFIVMYDSTVGNKPLLAAIKSYGAKVVYDYGSMSGMALSKPTDKTLEETMSYFRNVKGVLTVNYDHLYKIDDPKPKFEVAK